MFMLKMKRKNIVFIYLKAIDHPYFELCAKNSPFSLLEFTRKGFAAIYNFEIKYGY